MKKVKVNYKFQNEDCEGYLIEDSHDIEKLRKFAMTHGENVIKKMVTSDLEPESFDHLSAKGLGDGLLRMSIVISKLRGKNPIYHVEEEIGKYLGTAQKILNSGSRVFVNEGGGLTPVDSNIIDILEEEEEIEEIEIEKPTPKIKPDTKVINLENDPTKEKTAEKYMEKVLGQDPLSISYILEMREYSDEDMKKAFQEFVDNGGETVYVYTTGSDVKQMYSYSELALEIGLNHFIFDFNQGVNNDIQEFIDWLKERANVELVDSEKVIKESKEKDKKITIIDFSSNYFEGTCYYTKQLLLKQY